MNDVYPSAVFPFAGLLGGPGRWLRLGILVRTRPRRGPGSGGMGAFLFGGGQTSYPDTSIQELAVR
eukprot:2750906-Pyramimonas_sp.AAC.1